MSKTTQAIVIGLVAAALMGLFLGFITSLADGSPNMFEATLGGAVAGCAAAFVFGNLSGNRRVANASATDRAAALAQSPPDGMAFVYIYRDAYVGRLVGMNIVVDGRTVAQIKSPRFTRVTVKGGRHVLSVGFGGFAAIQSKPEVDAFDFPPGTTTVLKVGTRVGIVQGGLKLEMQPDLAIAKQRLMHMPMVPADLPEP